MDQQFSPDQQIAAAKTLEQAIARLDARGLTEQRPVDDDPAAGTVTELSVDGLTTLLDLVTLFNVQTSPQPGQHVPDTWALANDIAGAFLLSLSSLIFADGPNASQLHREAVRQLRAAAKRAKH